MVVQRVSAGLEDTHPAERLGSRPAKVGGASAAPTTRPEKRQPAPPEDPLVQFNVNIHQSVKVRFEKAVLKAGYEMGEKITKGALVEMALLQYLDENDL
ncbi:MULTISPECIES: hypothetical protein [Rhodococcus erythropolis group]|uniref:Uncharacterized protein n=1 Tax=Rhodococcus erythropolis TaxID=1833 RepID=A0A8I0ZW11_RHOER|nr:MULTISPECIES: hypothetical protein [Rhodococcus erythropolis group]MBH5144278.1 hypothetical protein [Rhodococcus erythropolis]MDJ0434735.1 hypothetical protein [Rhodococcus qingshengii]QEM25677.1 hypothetical protein D6M20_02200 [Rhodococcus qingshengii]